MSQHWEEVIQNPVLVCVALGVTATCKGHSPHPGSHCAGGSVKQDGHVCPKEWQALPWCSPRCGFTGRGDVNEVPVLSPRTAHCGTRWQSWKAQYCLPFSKVMASGPVYIISVQRMIRSGHVCWSCRRLVVHDPCQPKGKGISSYFAVTLLPDRVVCPWKAFCLGETVSLVLLFHVKLILMQHLLIQKHSVLQAKKKLSLLCQIPTSGQVVKRCYYFASTFPFDRMYVSALCREELSLIGVVVLRNNLSVQLFSEALSAHI